MATPSAIMTSPSLLDDGEEIRLLILGQSRTGTSLLLSLLQSHPDFVAAGHEPLAEADEGKGLNACEHAFQDAGASPLRRASIAGALTPQIKSMLPGGGGFGLRPRRVIGCRMTPEQLQRAGLRLDTVVDTLGIRAVVVISRRFALETLASMKIVERTQQIVFRRGGDTSSPETAVATPPHSIGRELQAEVSEAELRRFIDGGRAAWRWVGAAWPGGVTPVFVRYEELAYDPQFIVEGLWRLIGVDASRVDAHTDLIRQHPAPVRRKVSTYRKLPGLRTELLDAEAIMRETIGKSDPTRRRLMTLAAGIIVCHCTDALLKEWIFNLPGFNKKMVYMLSFLQVCCVVCLAFADSLRTALMAPPAAKSAPRVAADAGDTSASARTFFVYAALGAFAAFSAVMTNTASKLVSFTTQVVFKSSKLPWVMVWRVAFLRHKRRPSAQEWAWCCLLAGGLTMFTFATGTKGKVAKDDMLRGLFCIVMAMSCDASRDTLQEAYRHLPKERTLLAMQACSLPVSGAILLWSGTYTAGATYARTELRFPLLVAAAGLFSYAGQRCVLGAITEFDSGVANLLTSVRKVATTLLSFVVYPKPFGVMHGVAIILIAVGSHGAFKEARQRGRPEAVVRPKGEWHGSAGVAHVAISAPATPLQSYAFSRGRAPKLELPPSIGDRMGDRV